MNYWPKPDEVRVGIRPSGALYDPEAEEVERQRVEAEERTLKARREAEAIDRAQELEDRGVTPPGYTQLIARVGDMERANQSLEQRLGELEQRVGELELPASRRLLRRRKTEQ